MDIEKYTKILSDYKEGKKSLAVEIQQLIAAIKQYNAVKLTGRSTAYISNFMTGRQTTSFDQLLELARLLQKNA